MAFFTDSQVLTALPGMAALTPEQVSQTVVDVSAVYDYANAHAGIEEAALRAWGETQSLDPDRMTRALQLLQSAGKLFALPDSGPLTPPTAGSIGTGGLVPAEHFTVDALRKAAKTAGVKVTSSATKDEVVAALARGPEPDAN